MTRWARSPCSLASRKATYGPTCKLTACPYLVPVTGAGPSCSIIGNALERGFGVTPYTDHFGAILSLKAVLADGSLYQSMPQGAAGPRLDGLFAQSNYGIVVEATIALARKPECCGALMFTLDDDPTRIIASFRGILDSAGTTIGAINLMNRSRVEHMLRGQRRVTGATTDIKLPPGAWFGFGSVYGSKAHVRATHRLVTRTLKGRARGVRIVTRRLLWWLRWSRHATRLCAALDIVEGKPSTFALPLAYAISGRAPHAGALDPARDGCGLIWYAPIVPMRQRAVADFCAFAEATCRKHGLPAPITLTALSPRHFAATLPLLFDRNDSDAERRVMACFERLHDEGRALGFVPYRIGAPFMDKALPSNFAQAIKAAIDPEGIMAPGRYGLD